MTALLLVVSASPAHAQTTPFLSPPATPPSLAQALNTVTIDGIRVDGAQRLESDTVISYLTLAKGDVVTPEKLDASLKALYATGLFEDVGLAIQGSTLVVTISENAVVNSVKFEGNDAISKDDLEKEVQLKPRLVYTLPKIQKDVQRILDLYRRGGRFGAVVEPKLVHREQNRVDVIFEITEGDRTGVRQIKFIGNDNYGEDDLRQAINTRESAWWRVFSSSDFYDPDRMNYDRDLLRKFYLNEGYMDFRVVSSVAELAPDREDFFITFTVEEGARYKFGKLSIQSDIKGLNGDTLMANLNMQSGDWYSAEKVEKSISKLTATLGDMQYAFVDIAPEVDKDKDGRIVNIVFHVKESPRVYIGRIDISGNNRTLDKVIRREILLAEGDPFSTSKIHRSEQNIKDLGFFESVKITPVDGAQPDRSNLNVEVKEKSTGEVSVGAGYSSTDGPLGDFTIRERNFLGRGQDVRLSAMISGVSKQFDLSFTEPYFLDRNLSAGGDIFHTMTTNQTQMSYDETTTGFTLRMGYPLSDDLRQRLNYTLQQTDISNVATTATRFIQDQQGISLTSMVGQDTTYDQRDSKLDPTSGYIVHFGTDVAGLGGDHDFLRFKAGGTKYFPLADQYVFSALAEAGYIYGIGQPVKISDRFFLGGDTLRGFQYAGMGPRALTNGASDALGGDWFARESVEFTMPTPLPNEMGFKSHVFTDAGTLGKSDETAQPGDVFMNEEKLRLSAGVGVSWESPFGPIRLDLADAILKQSYDKTEFVHFSFGTKF